RAQQGVHPVVPQLARDETEQAHPCSLRILRHHQPASSNTASELPERMNHVNSRVRSSGLAAASAGAGSSETCSAAAVTPADSRSGNSFVGSSSSSTSE